MPYKEPLFFRLIPWFIGFVFVVMILFWVVTAFLVVKVGEEVGEHGLKAAVERIWCGANGCK